MLRHPNNAPGRRIHGSEFWAGLAPTPKPKGSMHTICLGPKLLDGNPLYGPGELTLDLHGHFGNIYLDTLAC